MVFEKKGLFSIFLTSILKIHPKFKVIKIDGSLISECWIEFKYEGIDFSLEIDFENVRLHMQDNVSKDVIKNLTKSLSLVLKPQKIK